MRLIFIIQIFTLLTVHSVIGQNLTRFTYSKPAMGTQIKIIFYAQDSTKANEISQMVFKKVNALNAVFSDYDPDSELSQLCNNYKVGKQTKISDNLHDILKLSKNISKLTGGLFDITVGPYTKMWRRSKNNGKLPTKRQLFQAKKAVSYKNISLNSKDKYIRIKEPEMRIDLGGIAKGYTADEVLKIMNSFNIKKALIDFGGDIIAGDPPPNKKGWHVKINNINHFGKRVSKILLISNMAIATSGDYYQKLIIGGSKPYSHIIDPSTGLGVTKPIQVTVIAPSGTLADSFASAFSIMPRCNIRKLLKKNKELGLHVFITSVKGNITESWTSEMFDNFVIEN